MTWLMARNTKLSLEEDGNMDNDVDDIVIER